MLHLAVERPLYEQMATLATDRRGDRLGFGGGSIQQGAGGFAVDVPSPGVWWLVARRSGAGFVFPDIAFPLVGPLSDVVLPPIHPTRGASCLVRLIQPAIAWVAPGRQARAVDSGVGEFPRWGPWRPWLRLDRDAADREYWLDPAADRVSSPRPVKITVGAPGHESSSFLCRSGIRIDVSLRARQAPLLNLQLVIGGPAGAGGSSGEVLPAAVLVDSSGWPVGIADEAGRVAVPSGSYRVLGPSGDEWRIQVEDGGTRRLAPSDRSVAVLGPNEAAEAPPAAVVATHWSSSGDLLGRQELEAATATAGNRGRTTWTVRPPAGAVETTVLAPGFEMRTVDWSLGRTSVELTPLRSFEGVVLADDSGEPLHGAEVALYGAYTGRLAPVGLTAPDGTFRVDGAETQEAQRLIVRAKGYRTARVDLDSPPSPEAEGAVVVRLQRAVSLVGRIVSSAGAGLAGSAALVGRQGPFPAPAVGGIDQFLASNPALLKVVGAESGGVFRFLEVSSAVSSVAVGAPGYATRFLPLRSNDTDFTLPHEKAGLYDLGDVVLVPEMAVEGIVSDERGLPLAGVRVSFARSPDVIGAYGLTGVAPPTGEVRTGGEGRFRIGGLAEGALIDLRLEHPTHASVDLPRVAVSASTAPVWLPVEMKEALELEGRVVDEATGEGVDGVSLQLLDRSESRQLAFERTGPEGRFVLRGVASFDGILEVEALGYEPVRHELADEVDRRISASDGLVLSLRRGQASVRGVVVASGAPVVGAVVRSATRESVITDGAGRFQLSGLPTGQNMVFCWPSGDASGRPIIWYRDIRPGINEFVFDLTPVEIAGRVEDVRGLPVAGATVRVSRLLAPSEEARSAPDGSFRLRVTPGRYRAAADADGYAATAQEIDVGSTEPAYVVLRLASARELRARVVGLAEEEEATVEVRVETAPLSPGGGRRLARSADSVRGAPVFVTRDPPEGTVVVAARARSSDRMQRRVVEVRSNGTTEVEIAFGDSEASGRLTGSITVDGQPLAGTPVFVIDERAGDAWAVRTDHRGAYLVEGLRDGRVDIAAVGERRTLQVKGESRADIRARRATLRGRVVLAGSGAPAAGFEVVATPAHVPLEVAGSLAQTMVARSGEDGSFRIGGLFQVPYRVVARRRGGPILGAVTLDLAVAVGEAEIAIHVAPVE